MERNLKLSPPWCTYYSEITAMFANDEGVKVKVDDSKKTVSLFVEDADKADALSQILVTEKNFGNVNVSVNVIPADTVGGSNLTLFERAFKGNSALSFTTEDQKGLFSMAYVVFVPEIVQFFNDDLSDVHGLASMLYADIARDIFRADLNVSFCTDAINKKGLKAIKLG